MQLYVCVRMQIVFVDFVIIIIIIIIIIILRLDILFFQAYNYVITADTTKYASVYWGNLFRLYYWVIIRINTFCMIHKMNL